MNNHIKVRTINGVTSFYTAQDGVVLKSISSIRFADVADSVFTIVKKDGEILYIPSTARYAACEACGCPR